MVLFEPGNSSQELNVLKYPVYFDTSIAVPGKWMSTQDRAVFLVHPYLIAYVTPGELCPQPTRPLICEIFADGQLKSTTMCPLNSNTIIEWEPTEDSGGVYATLRFDAEDDKMFEFVTPYRSETVSIIAVLGTVLTVALDRNLIYVGESVEISGALKDELGRPIAGAAIDIAEMLGTTQIGYQTATTDLNGEYAVSVQIPIAGVVDIYAYFGVHNG